MTIRKSLIVTAAATLMTVGALAFPLSAAAQENTPPSGQPRHTSEEIAKAKPSGRLEVEATQVRLLIGGSSGKGTLYYQGKQYPVTLKGGSAGGVGVTKVTAAGDVYFLNKLEDFPGLYTAASMGAAVGAGTGASQFENNRGVFLKMKSKTEGVALNLGLGAVQIDFAK